MNESVTAGRMDAAWGALRSAVLEPFSLLQLQQLNLRLAAEATAWKEFVSGRQLRIAVLGGYTTQPITQLLLPLVLAEGYWAEIHEATYNTFETEPLDPKSSLYEFKPDIILVATGSVNLTSWPAPGATEDEVSVLAERVRQAHVQRWASLTAGTGAQIIQHNFDPPSTRPLGRLEGRYAWSSTNFVRRLNAMLWDFDGRGIRVLDIHQLATDCGSRQWHEPRWFFHSKHGFAPGLIHHYGRALSGLLRGMFGTTRKCLVTDLDNTLWVGVVGDDGPEGVELGTVSATGEAHAAFGAYLKALRGLGVVLAVNSKNDEAVAAEVFATHPESPLRRDDFAAFVCNWNRKSDNLRDIARRLNLGLDSLVFVDDSAAECEEVRIACPEVTVVELSGDAAHFRQRVEALQLFAPLDFTADDFTRAQSYHAQALMAAATDVPATLGDHLAGLRMEAKLATPQADDVTRVEQLFRKTNQFNLSGVRYERTELERLLHAPDAVVLAGWLTDRFAQHGLVAAVVAHVEEGTLIVDNWVMSCRVFTRTLEECMVNHLLAVAKGRGCHTVRWRLVPTPKNDYARRFFGTLGWVASPDGSVANHEMSVSADACHTFVQLT